MEHNPTVVRAFFEKAGKHKHLFPTSKCIVPISVGQRYHEDEKFEATMKLINNHFQSCIIMVCDSLQRHTLEFKYNLTPEEAYARSIQQGNEWIARNQKYINTLTIPHEIMRWDRWLKHPEYFTAHQKFKKLIQTNQTWQNEIKKSTKIFLDRMIKYNPMLNKSLALNRNLKYLREEVEILLLWPESKPHFILYPCKNNPIMKLVCSYIETTHPQIFIKIEFKKQNKSANIYKNIYQNTVEISQ